ncbi:MAG: class I SAM-dependent methyltransferase [Planctomycetota bacterium]
MARAGEPLARPATDADLANPLAAIDPDGWLGGSIAGRRVLCLAAGGGRQSVLAAAAGAEVTVVDTSGEMLAADRRVAAERGLRVATFQASMTDLSMLPAAGFDAVLQPVSTCYVPDVGAVYRQVARVLRAGGVYVSQHKTPTSLQASTRPRGGRYTLDEPYYRDGPLPPAPGDDRTTRRLREAGAAEFLHRWEELIGGLCRAGFVVEDLLEPSHALPPKNTSDNLPDAAAGSFARRARYVTPYVRIKARRLGDAETATRIELPP